MPAKKPQDHKAPVEPFVWTAPDGRTVSFLPFTKMPLKLFRQVRDMDELEGTFAFLDFAVKKKADREVLDEQALDDVLQAIEQWQGAGDVAPGESQASSS